jgi:hypothetical protein
MWESIKQLLKTDKDKAVLMENGKPKYVILSVEEYLKLNGETPAQDAQTVEADLSSEISEENPMGQEISLAEEFFPGYTEEFNFTDAVDDELLDVSEIETYATDNTEKITEEYKSIDLDDLPV